MGQSTTATISTQALPAGLAAGDLMIMIISSKADALPTITVPSGWTAPADNTVTGGAGTQGAATGGVNRCTMIWREWQSGDIDPDITVSASASPSLVQIVAFTKAADETWEAPICASAADTAGSTSIYDPPAAGITLDLGAGDWLCSADAINDDGGTPTVPGTLSVAGVTLGTVVNRVNSASSTGNDSRLIVETAPYTSGAASAGPDRSVSIASAIANMAGCSIFFRLRVAVPALKPKPAILSQAVMAASLR